MSATPTPSPDALPIPERVKHTPGPWEVMDDDAIAEGVPCIPISADRRTVCDVASTLSDADLFQITDEDRANAFLIAASPDLLAALQAAQRTLIGLAKDCGGAAWLTDDWHAGDSPLRQIDAAIRAAQTGER